MLGIGQSRTHMLVVARDLSRIFTSDVNSDTVTILDRATGGDVSGWTATHVPVGKGPEGFDVSPDGKELWAANSHDGTVSVVDIAARRVAQTLALNTKFANRLKSLPTGSGCSSPTWGTGTCWFSTPRPDGRRGASAWDKGAAGILVAGDGRRAYVAVSPDKFVAVVDIETLTVTGRVETGKGPDGMARAARSPSTASASFQARPGGHRPPLRRP